MHQQISGHSIFREYDAVVAESIVVDGDDILWCDITRGLIRRSPTAEKSDPNDDVVLRLPDPVCSFHLADSGFVVSLGNQIVLTNHDGADVRVLATIEHATTDMRLNEGKVDPAGRWVTGSMELSAGKPIGAFYSVDTSGAVRRIIDGIGTANGLEWSPDGTRIYFTDTSVETIFTADYSTDGSVTNVEVFHRGAPHDGLVMDLDGNFWSGIFGEGRVMHLDREGIEQFSIPLPAPNLTSVAFRGNTLYVGSAREKLTEQQRQDHPLSGSLFAIETASTAAAPRIFRA